MSTSLDAIRALAVAGRHAEAERALDETLTRTPGDPEAWALRAWNAHAAGRPADAQHALERTLALAPEHAAALSLATSLALARGDAIAAHTAAARLVALRPGDAHALYNLGIAAYHCGDHVAAHEALAAAIVRAPRDVAARLARAALHLAGNDTQAAAADYRAAVIADPQRVEAWVGLGVACLRGYDGATAREAFEQVVALAPANADGWRGLAEAHELVGAGEAAVAARERELALRPDDVGARLEYAMSLARQGRIDAARSTAAAVAQRAPDGLLAPWLDLQLLPYVHRDASAPVRWVEHWRQALGRFEALDPVQPAQRTQLPELLTAAPNFYRHYLGGDLTADQRRYGALLTRWAEASVPQPPPRPAKSRRSGRLRVGFASAHLRRHTVRKLFGSWIADLDRTRFEVVACQLGPTEDDATRSLATIADEVIGPLHRLDTWVEALHRAELDALIWLDVGMDGTTQALAPVRFAPLQCVAWGHPVTTGLPSIDVFLSGDAMEPPDADAHYTERLVRLPNLGISYRMPEAARGFVRPPRDPSRPPRLLCLQSAYKLTPENLDLFARLAARLPQATFEFIPHPSAAVRAELGAALAERFAHHDARYDGRVTLHPYQPEAQFQQRLRDADLVLDTLGWSGGNTTLEAIAFDLPVVTLPGAYMRSRHTHAIVSRLDLGTELSARDDSQYIDTVVRLATDPAYHAHVAGMLQERKARLYNDPAPVAALAELLSRSSDVRY